MAKNLLIVESPAKAKTIEKYLGKDFSVKSSYGHIRDLEKGGMGIDIQNGFQPKYVVSPEKTKVVKELKDQVAKSEVVWLATDEDREGEAISWHLCEVLGLNPKTTKRIVFREITKNAIQNAVDTPRTVDLNLVNAQQARRVLDRLVGFELSEILWKKIKGKLSAGRVQSVALRLVVDREREILAFKPVPYFKVQADFLVQNQQGKTVGLQAELPTNLNVESDAEAFLKRCKGAIYTIKNIEKKPAKRRPAAPFTTSTLQQEASRKLGFGVSRTMVVAQRLYEEGFISYMRTDSTVLSETALHAIAKEITEAFGKNYLFTRQYATKNSNAQEAHEAIRPTYIERKTVTDDRDMQRLYELIWKRTIASQMADAELERTIVNIGISTTPEQLIAEGEVLKFDGFLKVYLESKDDDEEVETKGMLPPLRIGQSLQLDEMKAVEKFTRTAARYTEASLVKRLEELGIGRPSTYAPIISKIMEEGRGYVIKESKEGVERSYKVLILKDDVIKYEVGFEKTGAAKQVLSPTDMGMIVCDFLVQYFKEVMDYSFTANVEKEFDEIAIGNHRWNEMIGKFYTPFHNTIEKTALEADRATGERVIGKDPESGRTVLVRMSRFGPVAQIGSQEELAKDEKPKYANLKQSQSIESISLEDALDLFKLPKYIGDYLDNEVTIGLGRFGPYVKFQEQFYSIPRGVDPLALELEDAIVLIEEKKSADAPIGQFKGQPITKGKGRFGPFIKWGDLYANVSKKYNFDNLTEKDSIEILEEKIKKESNRYIRQWEAEKISIENGRWGPFIRFGKNMIKLPKLDDGQKHTSETAMTITLDEVKKAIEAEIPDAFAPKVSKAKKK